MHYKCNPGRDSAWLNKWTDTFTDDWWVLYIIQFMYIIWLTISCAWWQRLMKASVQASSQVKYIPRISTEQAIITGIVLSPLMALGPHVDSKLDSDIIQYQKSPHIFLTHVMFTICIQYQKRPRILFGYIGSICNRGIDKIQTLYL